MKVRVSNDRADYQKANEKKITEAISAVEGKATVRKLYYERLVRAVERAEKQLEKLKIPKKFWTDCVVVCEPEAVCNSYNRGFFSVGTHGKIKRFPTGWFVVDIDRTYVRQVAYGSSERNILYLAETAKAAIPVNWIFES